MKTKKKPIIKKILFTIVIIIVLSFNFLSFIGNKITPKVTSLAKVSLNHHLKNVASNFKEYTYNNKDILIPTYNNKNEVTSLTYDMKVVYEIAGAFTSNIKSSLKEKNNNIPFITETNNNKILFMIPIGALSNQALFTSMGPKIPVQIYFVDNVFTEIKTKVTDYGINNALIEIYLSINLTYEIVSPFVREQVTLNYNLPIDQKIITGVVPNIIGHTFEAKTTFFNVFP